MVWQNNDVEYWRREVEDAERQLERMRRDAQEEREMHRREMRNRAEEALCTAESWEEALRKATYRFQREVNSPYGDESVDNMFIMDLKHVQAAQTQFEALQEWVDAEIAGILERRNKKVLEELEKEFPGEKSTTKVALEENDYSYLVEW